MSKPHKVRRKRNKKRNKNNPIYNIIKVINPLDIIKDFKSYINNKKVTYSVKKCKSNTKSQYSFWNGYDDDDYDDLWYTGYRNRYKSNEKFLNQSNYIEDDDDDILDPNEGYNEDDNDFASSYKDIYFYTDVNKFDFIHFTNTIELDSYMTEHGIELEYESSCYDILNSDVIHCCIDPLRYANTGEKILLYDYSYTDLKWSLKDLENEHIRNNREYIDVGYEYDLPF